MTTTIRRLLRRARLAVSLDAGHYHRARTAAYVEARHITRWR